jgi:hypothetical protein
MEKEIKKKLKSQLKGATGSTIESLVKRIISLPYERMSLATEAGAMLAANNVRAAIELLKATPEVSRLTDISDLRVWGETCKRLSATSADTAIDFIKSTASILEAMPEQLRSSVLRLINKQSALSASTAVESFRAAAEIIRTIGDEDTSSMVLGICLELARHSVKHSNDLLLSSPKIITELKQAAPSEQELITRCLALTSQFAFRAGGTAAEFFLELPVIVANAERMPLAKLFKNTEDYLERSGGVALQYFKAAGCVLRVAGEDSFERWTSLARRVALQGNAASYHFMRSSPQIINDLATRSGSKHRATVVSTVLEIVEEVAQKNNLAAVECFKASPVALGAASLNQFRDWALKGIAEAGDSSRRIQAYYSLESKASQESLFRIEGGLMLDSVAYTLRLYVEGLTGRSLNIAPLSSIPDEAKIGDGKTIYLPSVVSEFEDEDENFRLFKVLAAHAAGQLEFETYTVNSPALVAARDETRATFTKQNGNGNKKNGRKSRKRAEEIDFLAVLSEYPNMELATRLFTTIENGRVDYFLRKVYRGIRRDLDFVRQRLRQRRPDIHKLPLEFVPLEILFQIAICGGPTDQTRSTYPGLVRELEEIIHGYVFHEDSTVADSLMATRRVYGLFVEQPRPADNQSEPSESENEQGESQSDDQLAADTQSGEQQQMDVSNDLLSFWTSSQPQESISDQEIFTRLSGGETPEQDLDKGDRAYYYDEWDRELSDYRTRWCRVIERIGSRGSRSFVEMVRSRYSGVISSIRHQFQMLRPENMRRIRGEIDGEDYDLQAVIDYALDKRSTGLINDRLYTRKLRRERDVAVSFLLDMSSSTARTISRNPNRPYTQPGQRIIDIEKEGLVLMSEALEAVGDIYSMQGFTSEGRRNVKFYVIKDFSEPYSTEVERRIGGISYQNNTRLGAAIRHATTRLAEQDARTKLLIVLSDGRPYDHDYGDSRYAREDTRIALRQARLENITPFCITIDRESEDQLKDMYGEVGYTIIDDVLSLPERLPGIYSRLTT